MKFLPYLVPLTPLFILVGIAIYRNTKRNKLLKLIRKRALNAWGKLTCAWLMVKLVIESRALLLQISLSSNSMKLKSGKRSIA